MKTTLIDSPVANVANISRALRACGAELDVTRDAEAVRGSRRIVLPGVGSFVAAMAWLRESRLDAAILDAVARGASLLGICVGHQVLFERSCELGVTRGLGLLRGEVVRLDGPLPVPQIGWNGVFGVRQGQLPLSYPAATKAAATAAALRNSLFDGIADGTPFYFVNSFAARAVTAEVATADYGTTFTAAVQHERIFGVQFHPEKSSTAGLRVLGNFLACN